METMEIKEALSTIAIGLRRLGEAQQDWERVQIGWQAGKPPFDDFFYYIALSAVWQTFSQRIEGEQRRMLVLDLYKAFKRVVQGEDFGVIERVLREYKASRFMAGVNLFSLWTKIIRALGDVKGISDPLLIQKTAEKISSRTQHWLIYAPLEAAIVVGGIFPALEEIVPPLGKRVMAGFVELGLHFGYPPIRKELEVIHRFLLHLAAMAGTNHLIIEMGIWQMGGSHQQR